MQPFLLPRMWNFPHCIHRAGWAQGTSTGGGGGGQARERAISNEIRFNWAYYFDLFKELEREKQRRLPFLKCAELSSINGSLREKILIVEARRHMCVRRGEKIFQL